MSCLLSTPVDKWVEEDIRIRKIKLFPKGIQKQIMRQWMGTTRYVYNRVLHDVKDGADINFYGLRNKHAIAKNNTLMNEWETDTPKDIRAGGIKDLCSAYKTVFSNLKRGNLKHFKFSYRSKKKEASIVIPKTAIKTNTKKLDKKHIFIYQRYLSQIKVSKDIKKYKIEYDCRLQLENNQWYLLIPVKQKVDKNVPDYEVCALDPGVRTFQTVYSHEKVSKVQQNVELLEKLRRKIDLLKSLRDKGMVVRRHFNTVRRNTSKKFSNLIDEMHYQTINQLTNEFRTILLPSFESQEMAKKNKNSKCNRKMMSLKHYLFKTRLAAKCMLKKFSNVVEVDEIYTSKTCTRCGNLKYNLGAAEVYKCLECNLVIDRDINGARNILLKYISLLG
jgi:transposase